MSQNVSRCPKMSKKCRKMSEPIMGENGRKWLGKPSKLVKKSSELSQNVPKMSQVVRKCPKMPTSDALLSEQTFFFPNSVSNRRGPDEESIPVGILKMKELGIFNVILEIDIGNAIWDFDSYPIERFLQLLKVRSQCSSSISSSSRSRSSSSSSSSNRR